MRIEKLSPAYKDYLWGGNRLKEVFGKNSELEITAESWELSVHPDGESTISGGENDGLKLSEYINNHGKSILGEKAGDFEYFPVLIKFIDARLPLSVQVHPSDEYALKNENSYGKTEMWYILDCEEDSFIYCGVKKDISPQEFEKRINDLTIEDCLEKIYVHPGDAFFIKSGTLHAIGAGILVCEIQQNSNLTYRVYDYGRTDANGQTRELHIEKALKVSNLKSGGNARIDSKPIRSQDFTAYPLADCRYFKTDRYDITGTLDLHAGPDSFVSLIIIDGEAEVSGHHNSVSCKKGDSIFIPADAGKITVTGKCGLIKTML